MQRRPATEPPPRAGSFFLADASRSSQLAARDGSPCALCESGASEIRPTQPAPASTLRVMLIDTHCHLTSREFGGDPAGPIARAQDAGVSAMITVATTPADARDALGWMPQHACVWLAAGIHPHQAGEASDEMLADLAALHDGAAVDPRLASRIVAVGETGLDFHYDFAPPDVQERVFRAQIDLALRVGRPLIIHARKSEERCGDILAEYPALAGRVVFHCFSGDEALAARLLGLGFHLSYTGVVTFKNADAIRRAAAATPADRIMVETDSPFLTPEPLRKVRPNEPALVVHTARRLADIRGESYERLAAQTTANAVRFFGLSRA